MWPSSKPVLIEILLGLKTAQMVLVLLRRPIIFIRPHQPPFSMVGFLVERLLVINISCFLSGIEKGLFLGTVAQDLRVFVVFF
jgi:hypothetical protein